MAWPAVGVFVGGQGLRMGGVAKGLLLHEGRPLIERVLGACRAAAAPSTLEHVYLVGHAQSYAATGVPSLPDAPAGVGPIGGLRALLLQARDAGLHAVAVAVDLPYLGEHLVRRLCLEQPGALVLAPRQAGRWQPLFARYQPAAVLPVLDAVLADGQSALQAVIGGLERRGAGVGELALGPEEALELRDWDRPGDMGGR
jgi:molybdenum cofactor guanylyltransferase